MHAVIFGEKGGIRKLGGPPHANLFLSMRKNFLQFFWLYLLHCPLETCLILSSVMEIQEVGHPFHFSLNIFSLSCQFYIHKILVTIVCFIREKSYGTSTLISLSKHLRKILKDCLSSEERMVLWSLFIDICCTTWRVVQNVIGWLWMRRKEGKVEFSTFLRTS